MSCKKKETPAPEPAPTPVTPPKLVVQASLENTDNVQLQGNIAFFYQSGSFSGGSVSVNNFTLGNSWPYNLTSTLTVSNPITWAVSGGVGGVPAQTITVKDMPSMPISAELDTAKTLTASAGFTIHNQAMTCDTLEYIICNYIKKKTTGNSTSMAFSASELSGVSGALGASTSLNVAISAYNYYVLTDNNKKRVFISKTNNITVLHFKP